VSRKLMVVLWPSFLVAAAVNALFFTVFDPVDFSLFGPFGLNRMTAYSSGFLLFWALGAASSAFTLFLQRPREEINAPR
jgi:hypothetical protein